MESPEEPLDLVVHYVNGFISTSGHVEVLGSVLASSLLLRLKWQLAASSAQVWTFSL